MYPTFFFFRFEKNDILRIVRALAIVRPSLIALQMPLSEEDEVFVEKCFQRSLLVSDLYGPVSFSPMADRPFLSCVAGTGEVDLLQRHPNLRMEKDGRNLPRW